MKRRPGTHFAHVLGVTTILDQTAEDILERNPRFLTRAKNFPGFFSFGPEIVPIAELPNGVRDLSALEVSTVLNGTVRRSNTVARMRYSPQFLVTFAVPHPGRGCADQPGRAGLAGGIERAHEPLDRRTVGRGSREVKLLRPRVGSRAPARKSGPS